MKKGNCTINRNARNFDEASNCSSVFLFGEDLFLENLNELGINTKIKFIFKVDNCNYFEIANLSIKTSY